MSKGGSQSHKLKSIFPLNFSLSFSHFHSLILSVSSPSPFFDETVWRSWSLCFFSWKLLVSYIFSFYCDYRGNWGNHSSSLQKLPFNWSTPLLCCSSCCPIFSFNSRFGFLIFYWILTLVGSASVVARTAFHRNWGLFAWLICSCFFEVLGLFLAMMDFNNLIVWIYVLVCLFFNSECLCAHMFYWRRAVG